MGASETFFFFLRHPRLLSKSYGHRVIQRKRVWTWIVGAADACFVLARCETLLIKARFTFRRSLSEMFVVFGVKLNWNERNEFKTRRLNHLGQIGERAGRSRDDKEFRRLYSQCDEFPRSFTSFQVQLRIDPTQQLELSARSVLPKIYGPRKLNSVTRATTSCNSVARYIRKTILRFKLSWRQCRIYLFLQKLHRSAERSSSNSLHLPTEEEKSFPEISFPLWDQ